MRPLDGHTQGLKAHQLKRLEALFRRKVKGEALVSVELVRHMAEISYDLGRQVGVLVDRGGHVEHVVVGEPARLYLPDIGRARAGLSRFRGLRLIRTELRGQGLTREDEADLAKLRLDAVVVLAIDPQGSPQGAHWAHLVLDPLKRTVSPLVDEVSTFHNLPEHAMALVLESEDLISRAFVGEAREISRDSAMLVGVWPAGPGARKKAEDSMAELSELARTAGIKVVDSIVQLRRELDPRTVLGRGKIEELTLRALELGTDVIIFDRDLSPSQLRAITNETDLKVLDRTQLILDIFARHAKSRDGKVQVELAQLKYALPRLIEKSTAMSRLTGGIGGQGPGETKLEVHRRRARDRIHRLEQEIEKLGVQRQVRRKQRAATGIPVVSIVGYTNAGKSTLLNALTNSDVLAENKLFATLDPTTRRLRFPKEREIILTDTVGFIRDLPKDLVNAFRATLEELEDSDLLVHVLDASDPNVDQKRRAVEDLLSELGLDDVPRVTVLNKIDVTPKAFVSVLKRVTDGVPVSAEKREGLEALLVRMERTVFEERAKEKLRVAEARGDFDDLEPEPEPEVEPAEDEDRWDAGFSEPWPHQKKAAAAESGAAAKGAEPAGRTGPDRRLGARRPERDV
ncbi:GTPase HflX [Myxococcota bacterium]|nr:GTPase HflX [Myxococcota bacterium]